MFTFGSKLLFMMLALNTLIATTCQNVDQKTNVRSEATQQRDVHAMEGDVDALVVAAQKSDAIRVNQLLAKGVDVNGPASRNLTEAAGQTPLIAAAVAGQTEMVHLLLTKGANVNARHEVGGTALTGAAAQGHLDVVKELLKAGADPNVVITNIHGSLYTALMYAMNPGNKDWLKIVDAMIAAGAEVNPKAFALSPLRFIIDEEKPAMLQPLLERDAKLNFQYEEGITALMYAARYSTPTMVKALLDAGADVNLKNAKGETALAIAEKYSRLSWGEEVIKVLKERGAQQ